MNHDDVGEDEALGDNDDGKKAGGDEYDDGEIPE